MTGLEGGSAAVSRPPGSQVASLWDTACWTLAVWGPSGCSLERICRREPFGQLWPLALVRELLGMKRTGSDRVELR